MSGGVPGEAVEAVVKRRPWPVRREHSRDPGAVYEELLLGATDPSRYPEAHSSWVAALDGIRAEVEEDLQAAAPSIRSDERSKVVGQVRNVLKEQVGGYEREADEAAQRGEEHGAKAMRTAADVVRCVTTIAMDALTQEGLGLKLKEHEEAVLSLVEEATAQDEAVRARRLEDDAASIRNCRQIVFETFASLDSYTEQGGTGDHLEELIRDEIACGLRNMAEAPDEFGCRYELVFYAHDYDLNALAPRFRRLADEIGEAS